MEVVGLIDRDRRTDDEIDKLEEKGIYTLTVAEVENLFCTPEIIKLVSQHQSRDKPDDDVESVKSFLINEINSDFEKQISLRTASEVKYRLNCFDEDALGKSNLEQALVKLSSSINIANIYDDNKTLLCDAIRNKDYDSILKLYNRKELYKQIGHYVGLQNKEWAPLIVRLANSEKRDVVRQGLKKYFGNLPD